jgi:hypothetical protein
MAAAQLTFWPEELHANHFQSQVSEADWLTRVATWPSDSYSLLACFVPNGLSGRTSLESCHPQEDGTLAPSSGRWQNSGMGSPTEFWTLSGLESPSAVGVCSLSHTLETGDVPQRYFLSAKACAGILRRAERRGKELPGQLRQALQAAAGALNDVANPEGRTMLSSRHPK